MDNRQSYFLEVDELGILTTKKSGEFIIDYILSGRGLKDNWIAFSVRRLTDERERI